MPRSLALLSSLLVLALIAVAAPRAESAISCGSVVSYLGPCIKYAQGQGPLTPGCCSGVKGLNAAAQSTPASAGISGLNPQLTAGIPAKCGVNIPYAISTSTDCSKVK
ncbi:non-specific lipid-transfer protein-like [Asparagus officinalis]|uniref:non-specific lipid-transfer protein-like n=1 Tax=Asparagus officinalis TaxID=4686 RepID=UPI00098E1844|nr:non-specific lipid-transfer protein-like [Asparagus officinalis]